MAHGAEGLDEMKVHLVDGTYELFRAHFALPSFVNSRGQEVAAVRGLVRTLLALLRQEDVTHLACAFDHVVESFRNRLFPGYKTGEGVAEELLSQFPLAERAVSALGVECWPMVEFEADDAIAAAAVRYEKDPAVEQVVICSPDKDLAQVVKRQRVVCLDRRNDKALDEEGVLDKFGVYPESIPDYLGLVGDAADGIPGIPKWGAKTAATVLKQYGHIESIPGEAAAWEVKVRGAAGAAASLAEYREEALLYRKLATLRLDVELPEQVEQLRWRGVPKEEFEAFCEELGLTGMGVRPEEWADGQAGQELEGRV